MRSHISNEKWKKIGSFGITLTIVLMLIPSGPANAVTIEITGLSSEYTQGNNVEFQIYIKIEDPDYIVPMSNFSLDITGPTPKTWNFSTDGTILTGDTSIITINPISTPILDSNNYSSGPGRGFDDEIGSDFNGFGYGSSGSNITFVYNVILDSTNLATGTYKVTENLNTGNATKPSFTSSKSSFIITAYVPPSGGGTGEKSYNIECYENSRKFVYQDQLTSFNYSYNCNIVEYLNFTGEGSLGKILIEVEMLYNTSTMIELDAPGEVYKNVNVWTGFSGWFSSDHLSDPTLTYTVNKSWVRNNNIKLSSINLYFYDVDKWIKLPTQKIDEDSLKYYFKSDLIINGSLGHMAVSGQFNPPPPKPTPVPTPTPTPEITPTPTPISWTGVWSESIPGFQIIGALSVIMILYVIGRRRLK
ncbi:MAG: PGF-pre-PGF domain-containing protein [ANME-2 cluster archaeon]|nr:MAG: PGF-pre-PGF domain-containing protein [ANME-2 cluster archaeon]